MKLRDFLSSDKRRAFLEKTLRIRLQNIKNNLLESDNNVNCENLVGAALLPLGVAGPIKIQGEYAAGEFYLPLATTEGALVASVNRGCKAVTEAGGANVYAYKVGTTRGPVFYTGSLDKSKKLYQWIKRNEEKMKAASEKTSKHLKFKKANVKGLADYVFIRFYFDTADAMGMNMATIATEAIVKLIEKETGIPCLSLAGNFDIDKKPAWLNFIDNRGIKAWAEVVLSKEILSNVLKTTSEKMFEVWLAKCMLGSAMSGSLGFNAHFANVIAALFIATGQDVAHVVEGSLGITTMRNLPNGNLYCSIYLPSLMIGTVGGGTSLPTQSEALNIMEAHGAGKVEKFAEIIAGAVLSGEISLLAALSTQALATSHKNLGRKKIA